MCIIYFDVVNNERNSKKFSFSFVIWRETQKSLTYYFPLVRSRETQRTFTLKGQESWHVKSQETWEDSGPSKFYIL